MSNTSKGESDQASRAVYALRQALVSAGFEPERDLPSLAATRFEGQTLVLLGRVTTEVAARLARVIAGRSEGGAQ